MSGRACFTLFVVGFLALIGASYYASPKPGMVPVQRVAAQPPPPAPRNVPAQKQANPAVDLLARVIAILLLAAIVVVFLLFLTALFGG